MKDLTSGSESNIGRNPMSLDLGLDRGDMDNVEKVQDFIRLVKINLGSEKSINSLQKQGAGHPV